MRTQIVLVSNVRALVDAVEKLSTRSPSLPGICVCHGTAGYGKTCSIRWLAAKTDGVFITALPFWTPHAMLSALMEELPAVPMSRTASMFKFVAHQLTVRPRPIFVDEADCIADRKELVETLRILHDLTSVPLILVGMDEFRHKMAHRPQLQRRILRDIEFRPLSQEDARRMAAELIDGVRVMPDLVDEIHRRTSGSAGLLVNELEHIERFARRKELDRIGLPEYSERLGKVVAATKLQTVRATDAPRAVAGGEK